MASISQLRFRRASSAPRSVPSEVQQEVDGEGSAVFRGRPGKAADCIFRLVDILHDAQSGPGEGRVWIVVRAVPLLLHVDEQIREILDFYREPGEDVVVFAALPGGCMLQRTVCLAPRRLAPGGAGAADQHVGATSRQAVKKRVVCGTDRPAKIGFGWSSHHCRPGQFSGRPDEIKRLHGAVSVPSAAIRPSG